MPIFRGGAYRALFLATAGLLTIAGVSTGTAGVVAAQPAQAGATITADLTLDEQGVLQVSEHISVPAGGAFRMVLPLRLQISDDAERVFTVSDVHTEGAGTAEVAEDRFTMQSQPGESDFRYAIHNTVGDAPGSQIFHWVGAMNTDIAAIDVALISPSFEMGIVDCKLGPPAAARPCANVRVEPDGVLSLQQTDLHQGDSIDLTLQMPPGTVPSNADVRDTGAAGPFSVTGPVLIAFGVLIIALLALLGFVFALRRRGERATQGTDTIDPLSRDGDRVQFTSPDGVLPGAAGVLLDEQVDPVDIAATVVDLAVRRYIWVTPIGEKDWRITRVNAPDEQLRPYEKTVYETLFPVGADSVTVAELRTSGRIRSDAVRTAMRQDAITHGNFVDRGRLRVPLLLGGGLILAGIVIAIALALTSGHALVGLAVALGGVAALTLPRFLPQRTARGEQLAAQVRALQRGLDTTGREQIPPADQETVFSRGLPYMLIGGRVDNWIRAFRELDPAADSQPGLYWFGGFERDRNLHRFAGHFPFFITALEGVFSAAGDPHH